MREILFRGRDEDGDWLESMSLAPHITKNGKITSYYIGTGYNTVAAETVGQHIDSTDENGKKIFEGDIVANDKGDIGRVTWYEEHSAFMIYSITENKVYWYYDNDFSLIEVIGNIHDNPELLKGDKDNA